MSDIGRPLRRHHGVPREDPAFVPDTWPTPAPAEPAPVSVPAEPLTPNPEPLVPA